MSSRSLTKDFHRLQKNIASFSNNEARIVDFADDLTRFDVELKIKDGYYKDGLFLVQVFPMNYPDEPPDVRFITQIFHPNIDDGYGEGTVCLNLLDEWLESNDLEDIVHGLLFLVKNPNLDDPLNPVFGYEGSTELENYMENFASNVRNALEGGEVEGISFKRNPGLGPQTLCKAVGDSDPTFQDGEVCDEPKRSECEVEEIPGTTAVKHSSSNALVLSKTPDSSMISILCEVPMEVRLYEERSHDILVDENCVLTNRVCEEKWTLFDKNEPLGDWLVCLMTALGKTKFEQRLVNIRTVSSPLWNFKPMTYLQRALKWSKR